MDERKFVIINMEGDVLACGLAEYHHREGVVRRTIPRTYAEAKEQALSYTKRKNIPCYICEMQIEVKPDTPLVGPYEPEAVPPTEGKV